MRDPLILLVRVCLIWAMAPICNGAERDLVNFSAGICGRPDAFRRLLRRRAEWSQYGRSRGRAIKGAPQTALGIFEIIIDR